MSHEIFGERFISNRVPAWHNLGQVIEEDITAMEGLRRLGEPIVTLEPLTVQIGGQEVSLPERAIIRQPTEDDAEYVPFGIVGPEYNLITAADVCDIWDKYVKQPIETMAFLRRGALFFVTSKLPAIDVNGDEVDRYLGATAPVDGSRVATAEEWPIRVVCANTLRFAQDRATNVYRVVHGKDAKVRMGQWLADMYKQAEANASVMKEAFEVLAQHNATEAEADQVITAAYPQPRRPRSNAPDRVMEGRFHEWDLLKGQVQRFRDEAKSLFLGAGTGMQTKAAKGTMWGVYNAVVETEDYRKGWNAGGLEAERVAESTLFGERAAHKQAAYAEARSIVTAA